MAKVEEYQQMMAWLTRPKSKFQEPRSMDQAALVDELEPGSLKDEMLKDFDPSQETYEEYLQRKSLGERPFNMNQGGRIGFMSGKSAALDMTKTLGEASPEDLTLFKKHINEKFSIPKELFSEDDAIEFLIKKFDLPKADAINNLKGLNKSELSMVEEILIDQNKKFDEISKLKPGTKGWKSGTGWQAAERSSVLRAARDYALYGKENLDALTEGSFPGKKYWELGGRKRPDTPHTGMKEQIKRQMKTKVKELIDEYPQLRNLYLEALDKKTGGKNLTTTSGRNFLRQRQIGAMDEALKALPKDLKNNIISNINITAKEVSVADGIPTFKTGPLDHGAPSGYKTTSTPATDMLELKYGTGPEGRYNQFVDEVKEFYTYPRSGGPKDQFSYARKAGMEIKDIKNRYFPDFSDKYVEKIITNTAKKEGINTVRPAVEDYVKTLKKDLRKPVSKAAKDIARQRAALDPTGVWKGFPKGVKKGKMHHMFGKDTGETLSRLMVDFSDETAWGSLEDALKNLDIEKRGLDLTTDAGRRRLAVIQDTEKRILKGKDVTGRTLKSRKTGETFPISNIRREKFKLERPGRKGKLGYEKFTIDDAGKVTKARKGTDLSKTVAAQHWDDVKSLANVDFKTLKKGSPEWTKIRKVMENAYGDIGKTINNLNPREIGTICSAIRALPGFSSGGSAKCITKINKAFLERPDDLMRSLARISKPSGKLKGVVNMAKTLGRGTGWFALGELAFAVPWAAGSYALGANKDEIISDITYGLLGKDKEEQLKAADPLYGLPKEIMQDYKAYQDIVRRTDQGLVGTRMGAKPGALKKATQSLYEKQKPFINEKGEFDMELFSKQQDKNRKAEEDWEKEKIKRKEERGLWNPQYDVFTDELMAAEGGIASLKK